ncbi:MAG: RidA family protein [Methyloligellaceae bacterium]
MSRVRVSQGSPFEQQIGYSRAIVEGKQVFVSGTTGFNYDTMEISEDVTEQTDQCLKNIGWALEQAGSSFEDVVRVRYLLPNAEDFEPIWPVLNKYFGEIRPAATMMVVGLLDPKMKIEIEVTAIKK